MKLAEIAERIDAHLKRFESDKDINKAKGERMQLASYYHAAAWSGGRFVYVRYISYQAQTALSRADALCYLEWLDAGNIGRHYETVAHPR